MTKYDNTDTLSNVPIFAPRKIGHRELAKVRVEMLAICISAEVVGAQ